MCIEQLVLSLLIIVLTIIEVRTGKIYDYNTLNGQEDAFSVPQDAMDAKLRADAL